MAVVTEDIVENTYSDFVTNNALGKVINENGIVNSVASGLGEVTTIGVVSALTGVPAWMIAGVEATGEYTSKAWNRMEETASGETTTEKYNKGLAYGATNAVWEMAQWGSGIGLNKLTTVGGSKGAASAVRVGIDTLFNAADTPFRSVVASETFGTDFTEEFEKNGGWEGVLRDTAIGLIGSVGSEVSDTINTKKIITQKKQLVTDYLENIEKYSAEGISIEEYFQNNGVAVKNNKTKLEVAEYLGDSKLYLIEKIKSFYNNKDNANLSQKEKDDLWELYRNCWNTRAGNIETKSMLKDSKVFLSQEEIETATKLMKSGQVEKNAKKYNKSQLDAVFNYTACSGFQINSWLNDAIDVNEGIKTRKIYPSVESIQNFFSGYGPNRVFTTKQGNILNELDSVIASAEYDDAIVTYRGVKSLYDRDVEIEPQNLKIGDSFESSGYQSSSIVFQNSYGAKNGTDIVLKVIVPPNSGTAAYIENISGVANYGQMEMLIKRDAKMTVVGDIEYKDVNGSLKTVIPVIVQ